MASMLRAALAAAAAAAALALIPLAAAAQGGTPVTFTLTIAGPYPGTDSFAVHIDRPVSPQDRFFCVAPGSGSGSVCASGQTYSVTYTASEWQTHPYWYERFRGGAVVQTFLSGTALANGQPQTVRGTFTYASASAPAAPVPATGMAAWPVAGMGAGLLAAGSVFVMWSRRERRGPSR